MSKREKGDIFDRRWVLEFISSTQRRSKSFDFQGSGTSKLQLILFYEVNQSIVFG
jgi:hypothetical protein